MKRMNGGVAGDVVAQLLDAVRVRATIFCRSTLRAPWGFAVKPRANPSFHAVTRGECWLVVANDSEPRRLSSGDLVVLPHGVEHSLRDEPSSPTLWLDDLLVASPVDANGRLRHGGRGAPTDLICGGFVLEGPVDPGPLLRPLPAVVHVRATDTALAPWVAATVELVSQVAAADAPGTDAVLARVAETMLTQVLRLGLAEQPLRVLRDPQIAAAVQLIHERPEQPWTVDDLAAEVAYSRSAFALRFREVVGEAPMAYVRRTRLTHAARLLQQTTLPLGVVARRSGYASEASLSRAFKRSFGISPGAYRSAPGVNDSRAVVLRA